MISWKILAAPDSFMKKMIIIRSGYFIDACGYDTNLRHTAALDDCKDDLENGKNDGLNDNHSV